MRVSDAEYVWRGNPQEIPPNSNPNEAYFAANLPDFCGISGNKAQFNRSCTAHTQIKDTEQEFEEEEKIFPLPWKWQRGA